MPPRFPRGLVTKTATPSYEIIPVPGGPGSNAGVMGNPFQQMLGGLGPLPGYHGMNINAANLLQQSKMGQCTCLLVFFFVLIFKILVHYDI